MFNWWKVIIKGIKIYKEKETKSNDLENLQNK